jgi:hypothetical protein
MPGVAAVTVTVALPDALPGQPVASTRLWTEYVVVAAGLTENRKRGPGPAWIPPPSDRVTT